MKKTELQNLNFILKLVRQSLCYEVFYPQNTGPICQCQNVNFGLSSQTLFKGIRYFTRNLEYYHRYEQLKSVSLSEIMRGIRATLYQAIF